MGDLFGDPSKGYQLMWSNRNGLTLDQAVEAAFDQYWFVLLPIEKTGRPHGWKLVLINEGVREDDATDNTEKT